MDYIKPGNISMIRDELFARPCELYFLGASVSTQRNGWPDQLADKLTTLTRHTHTVRKTCVGGVGLLYGVSHVLDKPPEDGRRRIAFIEFSTGDLNFGLTPIEYLRSWLREMIARLQATGALPLIVHNWRADYEPNDRHGIRAAYDDVATEAGLPVIENHRWIHDLVDSGAIKKVDWFRDLCHTTDAGACAYADQIIRVITANSFTTHSANRALQISSERDWIRAQPVAEWSREGSSWSISEFCYTPTGQRFSTVTFEHTEVFSERVSGELLGIAVISGPRSTWLNVSVNGKILRKLRVFDRHSHYERYLLCVCNTMLDDSLLEIRCSQEPLDVSISDKVNDDFALPRQLKLVELIGRNLCRNQQ